MKNFFVFMLFASSMASASEFCHIDDETYILDEESYRVLQRENYATFSHDFIPSDALIAAPQAELAIKGEVPETSEIFSNTSLKLVEGPDEALAMTSSESARLLRTMGRTAEEIAAGALEAMGPVGDALAVGLWAMDVAETFEEESSTAYDRFASIMGLIDWFGILRIPEREIDRNIIASRWDKVANGEHYSFTVHDDLATEQDRTDKERWGHFSNGYHDFLERTTLDYSIDVILKYQLHYLEAVHGQSQLAQELLNSIDQELYKSLAAHLGASHHQTLVFFGGLEHACDTETNQLLSLLAQEDSGLNSNSPTGNQVSEQDLNHKFGQLQQCQFNILRQFTHNLQSLSQGTLPGFDREQTRSLFTHTFDAKKTIIDRAITNLEQIKFKLIQEMHEEGLLAIDKLFNSGSVSHTQAFLVKQATRSAIDEMVRSLLYRPATSDEQSSGIIVLEPTRWYCANPDYPTTYNTKPPAWAEEVCEGPIIEIPADTRQFNAYQDEVIAAMRLPEKEVYFKQFYIHIRNFLEDGWDSDYQEGWLQQQAVDFLAQQRETSGAQHLAAEVRRWLFDRLGSDCPNNASRCAAWDDGYLAKYGVNRSASLYTIEAWLADYSSDYYVHSTRVAQLRSLLPQAIAAQWERKDWQQYRYFANPYSVDIQHTAPKVYAALVQAQKQGANTAEELVSIMKQTMKLAMDFSETQDSGWLTSQLGDFHRYAAIARLQQKTTGHTHPELNTYLFNETLPLDLTRFATGDISGNYITQLDQSLSALLQDVDISNWVIRYRDDSPSPLEVRKVNGTKNVDIKNEPLAEQLAIISQVVNEYDQYAFQYSRRPLTHELDYNHLQELLFTIAGNVQLQDLPFMSQFIAQLGFNIDSLKLVQAKAKSKLAELNSPIQSNKN